MDQGFLGYGPKKGAHRSLSTEAFRCSFLKRRALEICREAQEAHFQGMTAKAIPIYAKSLRVYPTAEAHALLGWAYSAHQRFDLAIQECLQSIEIDPDYGTPYNDIGSYLVSQGKLEESISWFERAKRATRYEARHFPYMNLGRVYEALGYELRAVREFERALEIEPQEEECRKELQVLRRRLTAKRE